MLLGVEHTEMACGPHDACCQTLVNDRVCVSEDAGHGQIIILLNAEMSVESTDLLVLNHRCAGGKLGRRLVLKIWTRVRHR